MEVAATELRVVAPTATVAVTVVVVPGVAVVSLVTVVTAAADEVPPSRPPTTVATVVTTAGATEVTVTTLVTTGTAEVVVGILDWMTVTMLWTTLAWDPVSVVVGRLMPVTMFVVVATLITLVRTATGDD